MKKDDRTEKENTARGISGEKNSPEGGEKEIREQSESLSSNSTNTNNGESAPENLPKMNSNSVQISGRKTLFAFFNN